MEGGTIVINYCPLHGNPLLGGHRNGPFVVCHAYRNIRNDPLHARAYHALHT